MNTTTVENRPETENVVTRAERTRCGRSYVPAVDILETSEELLLVADVPGARAEDIDVHCEQGTLTLTAKVEPRQDAERTDYLLHEFGVGDYCRSFQIGEGVDATKISAAVKNGVFTLHLSKAETAKPRKITVRSA